MAQSRAFRFFPARPEPGAELIQTSTNTEADPTIINIVAYNIAMSTLCDSLLEELVTTRRTLSHVSLQLAESRNPPSRIQDPSQELPIPSDAPGSSFYVAPMDAESTGCKFFEAQGAVLEGVHVIPHSAGGREVDTTLRLGRTPPTAGDCQAE